MPLDEHARTQLDRTHCCVGCCERVGYPHQIGQRLDLLAQELMLQQRPVEAAVTKVLDGLDFMNSLASLPELDPPLKVITKGLVLSLHIECQVRRETWTLIRASE